MLRGVTHIRRTFCTEAAKNHAPPKRIHGVTGRYAGAVYTAASKAGILDKVENELVAFSTTLAKSPTFAAFLSNPTIPRGDKANLVRRETVRVTERKGEGRTMRERDFLLYVVVLIAFLFFSLRFCVIRLVNFLVTRNSQILPPTCC